MNTINLVDVLTALNNLMGRRTLPGGEQDDLKRYCQMAFDYAWRYYKWSFSLKTAVLTEDSGEVWMPEDFDFDGWRKADGLTELSLEEQVSSTSSSTFALEYDFTENRYKTNPAAIEMTITYQVTPPTLGTDEDGAVPFPSAMTVAMGAAIYAKQAENPTRADIQQEWDEFHHELDRHAGRADNNRPRSRVRNFHDRAGTFPGDVGA